MPDRIIGSRARGAAVAIVTLALIACAPSAPSAPTAAPQPTAAPKPTTAAAPAATTAPAAATKPTEVPKPAAPAATAPAATAAPKPAAAGARGGELVVSMFEDADKLDPTFGGTAGGRLVFTNFCEKLYDLSATGDVVPQLASAPPEFSPDGKSVTIKIRPNLKFNDGTALDGQAVKTSLDRHKALQGSRRSAELASVSEVSVVDPTTVRLTLSAPNVALLATFADRAGMIMSPAQLTKLGENFSNEPVCVGPFQFKERVQGDRIVLERAPNYYDADKVMLDRVVFKFIADDNVRTANLRSGDVQVLDRLATTDVPGVEGDSSFKVKKVTTYGYAMLSVNIANTSGVGKPQGEVNTALAKDPRIREAFELSLDRNAINQVGFNGLQEPGCTGIPPFSPFAPKDVKCSTRDVARAKDLIAQAGAATPINVELTINANPVYQRLGELIQSMVRESGFNLTVKPLEGTTALDSITKGEYQMSLHVWSGRIDPDGNLYNFQHAKGPDNYANASDPKLDELLDTARTESNLDARKKIYADAVNLIQARRSNIYMYFQNVFTAWSARAQGYDMYADGMPRLKTVSLAPR